VPFEETLPHTSSGWSWWFAARQRELKCLLASYAAIGMAGDMPSLSERIGLKNKNAEDSTDCTDSKNLADDTLELERSAPAQD
jgi:hypothetical protein